jgi:uncharacterized protein (TIGR00255 family)
MIASMTGFGREVLENGRERIAAELRSVNSRGLKVTVRLPSELAPFQPDVEALVRSALDRGTVHVEIDYRSLAAAELYAVNRDVLKLYTMEIERLKGELGVPTPLDLERLLSLPGVIVQRPPSAEDPAALWARVRAVIERALAALNESRRREGAALADDLAGRRRAIEERLESVRRRIPENLAAYKARFDDRIRALLEGSGVKPDPEQLAREVALFAERTDVSEEVSRLSTHLVELERILASSGSVGRRLEFLAQEMLREANTMGSKSQESAVVRDILAIKLEVDKIKEQVANVE